MAKEAKEAQTKKNSTKKNNDKQTKNKEVKTTKGVKKENHNEVKTTKEEKKVNDVKVVKVDKKKDDEKIVKVEKKKNDEKVVKEKKVNKKNNDSLMVFLKKIDDNRWPIVLFVVGFLLATLIFRCIFWPDRIATLKDGSQPVATLKDKVVTADDLYTELKSQKSVDVFINMIDDIILSKKYPSNDDMEKEISNTADYYYSVYEQNYGYTKDAFLSQYGFENEGDFLDTLRLEYRRNKYYEDYVLGLVTDKEIQKYYDDDVFGDVDSKHILVSTKDNDDGTGLSDDEAKKLANEIIGKLNDGTSWDDVVSEYKDKIVTEDLGYMAFNASLESSYLKECKDLAVGEYSKSPVLTSYGYHIVFKKAQKDKPELKDVKDDVKEVLADDKKNADNKLFYKALVKMREEAGLKFSDTKLGEEYNSNISQYK